MFYRKNEKFGNWLTPMVTIGNYDAHRRKVAVKIISFHTPESIRIRMTLLQYKLCRMTPFTTQDTKMPFWKL